ncbi:MAG: NAD(+)/NADH kinase [Clostridia bacterium]|nr:NAD(+)/NADH kinase [Clostridia bacterium]
MKKIAIITNPERDRDFVHTRNIVQVLHSKGAEVYTNTDGIENAVYVEDITALVSRADAAVVLGGDGTVISVGKICAKYKVPVLGFNLGRVGFLVELEKEEIEYIARILTEDYKIESRIMLYAEVIRNGQKVFSSEALNDVVISKGGVMKMVHLNLEIDGLNVNEYYADGIILSTPTGSTAYSLSAGGPVVLPELDCVVVNPVCAHTVTSRPMVISAESKVKVKVDMYHNEDVVLSLDGAESFELCDKDEVCVIRSENTVNLIRFENKSYFDVLRTKLSERN